MTDKSPEQTNAAPDMEGLQAMAEDWQLPVLLCDIQMTRRQRVHMVAIPGEVAIYADTQLVKVLQHLDQMEQELVYLVAYDIDDSAQGCYMSFTQSDPRSIRNG